jgi:hypothetical protein
MDSNLTSAIGNLKSELRYENYKLSENHIVRFESANVEIQEEFSAKLRSEIRVVLDNRGNVSREIENKITTLNNTIKFVRDCMKERMKANVGSD